MQDIRGIVVFNIILADIGYDAHGDARANRMFAKPLVVKPLCVKILQHFDDTDRCRQIVHGIKSESCNGSLQGVDPLSCTIHDRICQFQHVCHHGRFIRHDAGNGFVVCFRVMGQGFDLLDHAREGRKVFNRFEFTKNDTFIFRFSGNGT